MSDPAGWVKGELQGLEHEAVQGSRIVSNLTSQGSQILSNATATVGHGLVTSLNTTSSVAGQLADKGKRAAIGALLWSSGKCPSFYRHLPEVPKVLAPLLASALQDETRDPSGSQDHCARAVVASLGDYIDGLDQQSESDKTVLKWIGFDRSSTVCSEQLMESLRTMEPIRQSYAEQYKMAVTDRLLLDVITEEALREELGKFCGEDEAPQQQGHSPKHLRGDAKLFAVSDAPEGFGKDHSAVHASSTQQAGAVLGGVCFTVSLALLTAGLRAGRRGSAASAGGEGSKRRALSSSPAPSSALPGSFCRATQQQGAAGFTAIE
jgi:hypothetical protein